MTPWEKWLIRRLYRAAYRGAPYPEQIVSGNATRRRARSRKRTPYTREQKEAGIV